MTERTIDILVRLNSKPADAKKLMDDFKALEKEAEKLQKILKGTLAMEGPDGAQSKRLKAELEAVNQKMKAIGAEAKKNELAKSLALATAKANQLRERMEKVAQVGQTLALTGTAILAPFAIAMKKYVDTVGETEPTSKRLVELGQRWTESQVRLGRVTAEIVLPALEKALDVVDKITEFAEKNPGFVQAALGVGGFLVVAGSLLSTVATVVKTLATIQSITGGLGIGTAATGATTGAAASGVTAATVTSGVLGAIGSALFLATVTLAAAEGTRLIFNAITGQNQTWADIGNTVKQLLVFSAEGWDLLFGFFGAETNFSTALSQLLHTSDLNIGQYVTTSAKSIVSNLGTAIKGAASSLINGIVGAVSNLARSVLDGISGFAQSVVSSITGLFSAIPGMATGGEISAPGLFMGGERGREFVMSNRTTKAAESIIGGTLTQQRLLQALAGGQKRISYYDSRKFDASVSTNDRRIIRNETMLALSEAIG